MGLTIPMYSYAQSLINFFSVPPPPPTRKPYLGPEYDNNDSKRVYFWPPVAHPAEQQDASSIEHAPYAAPSKSWADVPTKSFSAPRFAPSSPTVTIDSTASTSSDDTRAEHDVERLLSPSHDTRPNVPPSSLSPHDARTSDSVPVPSIHDDSGSDAPNGVATTSSQPPVVPSFSAPSSSAPPRTELSSPPPSHDVAKLEGENVETDVPGVDTTKPRDLGPGDQKPDTLSSPPNDNDAHLPEALSSSSPDPEANDVVPRPSHDSSPSNPPSTAPSADRALPAPTAAEVAHVPERDGPDDVVADGIDEETPTADDAGTDSSGEPSVERAADDVRASPNASGPIPLPSTPPKGGVNAEQYGPVSPRHFELELEVDAAPPTLSPPTSTPLDPPSPIPAPEPSSAGAPEGFDAQENVPASAQDPESSSNADDHPSGAGKDSSSAQELPVVHEPEDEVLSVSKPACGGDPSNVVTHPPNGRDVVPSISDSLSVSDGYHSGQGEPTPAPTADDKAQEGEEVAAVKQTKDEEHETLNERSPSLPLESSSSSPEGPSSPSTTSEAEAIPDSSDPHRVLEPDLPSDPLPPSSADEDALLARGPSASGLEKLIPSNDDSAHANEGDEDPFAASQQSTGVPPIQDAFPVPDDNAVDIGDALKDAGGQNVAQPSTDLPDEEPVTVEEDASEEPITGPVTLSAPDPPSALPEESATAEEAGTKSNDDEPIHAPLPSSNDDDQPTPIAERIHPESDPRSHHPAIDNDAAPRLDEVDATRLFPDAELTMASPPTLSPTSPLPKPAGEIESGSKVETDSLAAKEEPPQTQDTTAPSSPSSVHPTPDARPDDEDLSNAEVPPQDPTPAPDPVAVVDPVSTNGSADEENADPTPNPPAHVHDHGSHIPNSPRHHSSTPDSEEEAKLVAPGPAAGIPVLSSPPASPRALAQPDFHGAADASPMPEQLDLDSMARTAPSKGEDLPLDDSGINDLPATSSDSASEEAAPAELASDGFEPTLDSSNLPPPQPVETATSSETPSPTSNQLPPALEPSDSLGDRETPSNTLSRPPTPEATAPITLSLPSRPVHAPDSEPELTTDPEEVNGPATNPDVVDVDVNPDRETSMDQEAGTQLAGNAAPSESSDEAEDGDVGVEAPAVDSKVPVQSAEVRDDTSADREVGAAEAYQAETEAAPVDASSPSPYHFDVDNVVDTDTSPVLPTQERDEVQQDAQEARAAPAGNPDAELTPTNDTGLRADVEPSPDFPLPDIVPEPTLDHHSDSESTVSASPRSITPSLPEGPPPAYGEDESYDQPPPPPPVQATPGRDQNGLFAPAAPKTAEPPAPPPQPVASNEPEPVVPESAAPGTSSEAAAATFLGDKPPFKPAPNKAEFQSLRNYFTGITLCSEGEERGFPNDLMAAKCGRGDYIEIWAFEDANEAPNAYRIANLNSGLYLAYQDSPHAGNIVTLEDDGSLWELRAVGTAGLKYILPFGTSLALDVPEAADMAPRTAVQPVLQYASDKESQMWADFDYNPR